MFLLDYAYCVDPSVYSSHCGSQTRMVFEEGALFHNVLGADTYVDWAASPVSTVPVPAAVFMFAPALLGLLGLRRKNRA